MRKENIMVFLLSKKGSTRVFSLTLPRKEAQRYFTKKTIRKVMFEYQGYVIYNLTEARISSKGYIRKIENRIRRGKKAFTTIEIRDEFAVKHFVAMYEALKEKRIVSIVPNVDKEWYVEDLILRLNILDSDTTNRHNSEYLNSLGILTLFWDENTRVAIGTTKTPAKIKTSKDKENVINILPVDKSFLEIIAAQI